ncbi:M64 family metallopeptidase [Dysgonomonas macrotermitis]|uniref:Peptidase M64 N-terminus n=1 Tax=Dysgonomonas macrotermitis TaxID=1346286 RepID=A0A1M5BEH0_9BACT|nr:M64 family metallopeptidase [Dysgonomonas macrotermitis]SHF40901.1 Peptidase M64 N-terminus [Dysgonomonas macrotermitis]
MKKLPVLILLLIHISVSGQNFDSFFINKTLRLDYIFAGNVQSQSVALDQLNELPQWAGRRHNLSTPLLQGNGNIKVYDLATNQCIYINTFSSLFQEWLTTPEAEMVSRSFENVFLIPFPKAKIKVEINLIDKEYHNRLLISHIIDPDDILIHKKGYKNITPYLLIHKASDNQKSINIAILAEGYTKDEMPEFMKYAEETVRQIFSYSPFNKYKDRFNVYAVQSESKESGVSIPRDNAWMETAFSSHFDTFYSNRYLTTGKVKDIHDALAGIPYEHIIILANTDTYGGGGIYNAYTLTTTGHPDFKPVVVHEFGHSFAGLADEYFYDSDALDQTYSHDVEPWEQNITTLKDFSSKWASLLPSGTPVPTPVSEKDNYPVGVFEGGGYSSKGIYRPAFDCRMRTNSYHEFCPVCQASIERLIQYYIE